MFYATDPLLWLLLLIGSGIALAAALLVLARQRRVLLLDVPHRHFLVAYTRRPRLSLGRSSAAAKVAVSPIASAPSLAASADASPPMAAPVLEGVLYVDTRGQCTFANQAARELLHWQGDDIMLGDVLAGGHEEFHGLLESLRGRGLVEHHSTTLAQPAPVPVEIDAVALRDRDDNLWGAAVFIHRPVSPDGIQLST